MNRFVVLISCVSSSVLFAHGGHYATPTHVHVNGGAIDVGAALLVTVLGVALLAGGRGATRE
jgi:hypothetical protein